MGETEIGVVPIQKFPVFGRIARRIDAGIAEKGLIGAMKDFINETETQLSVKGKTSNVSEILRTKPVILVANHEHEGEVFTLLASLPDRKDVYVIGVTALKGIGENFSSHLLTVYIRPSSLSTKEMKLLSRVGTALKLGTDIPTDAHERNIQSITKASDIVKNGGLVIMFPGGARKENIWSPGIGHLVFGIGKNSGAYLVKAHIKGTSNLDFLRIVPGLRKVLPKLTVTFAEPKLVSEFLTEDVDPKKLAKILQDEYNDWVAGLF